MHVYPAFFEPINEDPAREEMRHNALNIHRNGTAPLEHIFNQMRCAGLDKLCLMPADYTSTLGCAVVENEEDVYKRQMQAHTARSPMPSQRTHTKVRHTRTTHMHTVEHTKGPRVSPMP